MKIGIVSDTHGNMALFEEVVDWLINHQKIQVLYHLGDDYDDVASLGNLSVQAVQVPGIYDGRYRTRQLPAKQFEMAMGLSILLVHSYDKDVDREDIERSDILLYGHTHRGEIRADDGKLYLNPGHLKGSLDKNMAPSFALLAIQDRAVTATVFGLDFKPVDTMHLVRSESGLYKG